MPQSIKVFVTTCCVIIIAILANWIFRGDDAEVGEIVLEALLLILMILMLPPAIFIRFTQVKESTAQRLMRNGALYRMLFAKKNYRLVTHDEEGTMMDLQVNGAGLTRLRADDAIPAQGYEPFFWDERAIPFMGGLRWYIWPIEEILVTEFSWTKTTTNERGEFEVVKRTEERVDHILVQQLYPYGLEVKGNDIVDRNGVPVEVALTLNAKITNPRVASFDVRSWFETLISESEPAVRNYINTSDYKEVTAQEKKKLDEDIFRTLNKKRRKPTDLSDDETTWTGLSAIEVLRMAGIELVSVRCRRFSLTKEYQDLVTEGWEGEMDAERRTESTIGAIFRMVAKAKKGGTLEGVQEEFDRDPAAFFSRYAVIIEMGREFIEQQLAADAKSSSALKRFYFKGGSGGLDIVAALGALFGGSGDRSGSTTEKKDNSKTKGTQNAGTREEDDELEGVGEDLDAG